MDETIHTDLCEDLHTLAVDMESARLDATTTDVDAWVRRIRELAGPDTRERSS